MYMAVDIFQSLRVGLLLLFCAAWGALAVGQTDITGPAKRTAPTRHGAQKNAPAQKRTTDSRKIAGDEGPAALLQKRFDAAQAAEQEGDLIRAESEYRQVLGMALEELGNAYDKLGSLPQAERAFKGAAEASANSDAALLGLAVVYLRQGEFQKGVDTVHTLLSQEPMHAQARQLLGKLYFSMNRFDAASLELQEARRLAPEDSETGVTLAFTYLRQQQLEKAQKIFAELLQRHGESPQIHIMFGAAYRETEYANQAVAEFKRAVALNADYPRLRYYMALAYLSQERSNAIPLALAELAEEIRRHPDEYSAHYLAGLINVQERKLQEALPYLEKAASLEPTNPDAPLYLGQALYLLDRTDQAVPLLQKSVALTKDPSRNQYQIAKAHYLLGQFLNRQGKGEEAKEQLGLAERYKAFTAVQDQQRLKIYLGSGMGGGDDLKNAVNSLEGRAVIIAPEPPNPEQRAKLEKSTEFYGEVAGRAYNQLGLLSAREEDFKRAAQLLEQAALWKPELADLQFNLGLAEFKNQNYAAAIAPLEKALARQPDRQDIRILLGMSCFFHADYGRTLEILAPVSHSGIEDPQVAYALGLSLVYAGNREQGIEVLRQLVEKYPQAADAHMAIGQAYAVREEYGNAASEFSRALELDATVPEGHYYLGLALLRRAQFAEAAAEFRHEIEGNPRHAKAQYHLGLAFASMDQTDDAVRQFGTAIRLDPSYGDAYYELGKALLKQGKVDEGVTSLERAAKLEANKSYIQYQLSQAYLKAGQNGAAQEALARYRDLKARERATPGARPSEAPSEPRP
jgi:tetratricopeptide (TPR) repeat protein